MRMEQPQFQLMDEDQLSVELIDAQYNLKKTRGQKNAKSLVILVNGIELAGNGEAVKQPHATTSAGVDDALERIAQQADCL